MTGGTDVEGDVIKEGQPPAPRVAVARLWARLRRSMRYAGWRARDRLSIKPRRRSSAAAEAPSHAWNAITALRDMAIILGVYVYFAGFSYVYRLYGELGIQSAVQSLSIQDRTVFAYNLVDAAHEEFGVRLYLGCLVVALLVPALKRLPSESLAKVVLGALAVGLFVVTFNYAKHVAIVDALDIRMGRVAKSVSVTLSDCAAAKAVCDGLAAAEDKGRLWLLADTESEIMLLAQPSSDGAAELPIGRVYRIRKDEVLALRVSLLGYPLERPGGRP